MKVERALVPHHYQRQSVIVDGVALNYVSGGSGRPVVLIHGNPGSHQDYTLNFLKHNLTLCLLRLMLRGFELR